MKLHIFTSLVIISILSCQEPAQETTTKTKLPKEAPKVETTTNEIVDTSNYVMTTLLHTNGKEVPTHPNHDFFVINYKGAKIYKAPDFNAALVDTFYCGQGIQKANLTTLQNDSYEIHPKMILEGHWLKMSAPIEGYIFSTDFSDIRPSGSAQK